MQTYTNQSRNQEIHILQTKNYGDWIANLFEGDDIMASGRGCSESEAIDALAHRLIKLTGKPVEFDGFGIEPPYAS